LFKNDIVEILASLGVVYTWQQTDTYDLYFNRILNQLTSQITVMYLNKDENRDGIVKAKNAKRYITRLKAEFALKNSP
jgi:hypothetical protein